LKILTKTAISSLRTFLHSFPLEAAAAKHPDVFSIERGGTLTTVVVDSSLYDEILSDEQFFNAG